MNRSTVWSQSFIVCIVLFCVLIITNGIYLVNKGSNIESVDNCKQRADTTITSQAVITDTTATRKSSTKSDTMIVRKAIAIPKAEGCNTCQWDALMKKGYYLIFLGIILLIVFFIRSRTSVSLAFFKSLRLNLEHWLKCKKAKANEAANAANSTAPPPNTGTVKKQVPVKQQDHPQDVAVDNVEPESITVYVDDPQKGKWGKLSVRNGRKLTAVVAPVPGTESLFKIFLKVTSTNLQNPLTSPVTFHLHPSFAAPNPKVFPVQGVAMIELIAWGAFTAEAETDNGDTKLKLHLALLSEAPVVFKNV